MTQTNKHTPTAETARLEAQNITEIRARYREYLADKEAYCAKYKTWKNHGLEFASYYSDGSEYYYRYNADGTVSHSTTPFANR